MHVLSAQDEDLHVSGAAASLASQLEGRAPPGGSSARRTRPIGSCATPFGRNPSATAGSSPRASVDGPGGGAAARVFHWSVDKRSWSDCSAASTGATRSDVAASSRSSARRESARRDSRASSSRRPRRGAGARRALRLLRRGCDLSADRGDRPPRQQRSHRARGSARCWTVRRMRTSRAAGRRAHRGRGTPAALRGVLGRAPAARVDRRTEPLVVASTTSTGRSRPSSTSSSTSASGRRTRSSSSARRGDLSSASGLGRADVDRVPRQARAPRRGNAGRIRARARRQALDPEVQERIIEHRAATLSSPNNYLLSRRKYRSGARKATGDPGSAACQPARPPRSPRARSDPPGRRDRPSLLRARSSTTFADGRHRPTSCESTERGLVPPASRTFSLPPRAGPRRRVRGIPKAERAELHELAARGLDRRDGTDELVGYHFEQAYRYLAELPARRRAGTTISRPPGVSGSAAQAFAPGSARTRPRP